MLVGAPVQLVLGQDIWLLHRWVVGGDYFGAEGLAWLAEQWPEWMLGVV